MDVRDAQCDEPVCDDPSRFLIETANDDSVWAPLGNQLHDSVDVGHVKAEFHPIRGCHAMYLHGWPQKMKEK